jgi:hypothetical protein
MKSTAPSGKEVTDVQACFKHAVNYRHCLYMYILYFIYIYIYKAVLETMIFYFPLFTSCLRYDFTKQTAIP